MITHPPWFFPVESDYPEFVGFPFSWRACRIGLEFSFHCSTKEVSYGTGSGNVFREVSDMKRLAFLMI